MKARAKKYAKLIYFKDSAMLDLVKTAAETRSDAKKKDPDKHYPFNCVSRFFPLAHTYPREVHMKFQLPCGWLYGESWGALRKCWRGYKLAKCSNDETLMREYANRIQKIQKELGIPTASFPNLGILGDIFFLYDKNKEMELRRKYMYDKVVCDRYNVESIDELVKQGKAMVFNDKRDLKRYQEKLSYDTFKEVFDFWANSESTQAYFKASQKRWDYRTKVKKELDAIKDELAAFHKQKANDVHRLSGEARRKRAERRKYLLHQKILKESELNSVRAVQLVKTDTGWKYAKEIIKNSHRTAKLYDYVPHYYLTDLAGHRLADYKEEYDMREVLAKDPLFYRLYLEDKEWQKIHSKDANINKD